MDNRKEVLDALRMGVEKHRHTLVNVKGADLGLLVDWLDELLGNPPSVNPLGGAIDVGPAPENTIR